MRVLFLDDAVFADVPGGSRMVAWELARILVQFGHDVTFLVPHHRTDTPDEDWVDGIQIVRYPGAGKAFQFVRHGREACARLWARGAYDIVHTHFAYAALGPLQAVPVDVARVRSFYGPWNEEGWVEDRADLEQRRADPLWKRLLRTVRNHGMRFLRRRIEARSLRCSRAVIVLSEQSRQEVHAFGETRTSLVKIPGGVDLARFVPAADRSAVRRTLGLPGDRRILLSVRRLTPRMGLDNLIEAMPTVLAQYPDTLLLIGGKGPEHARLAELIAQRGLQNSVTLLGFISHDQLASYYQAANAFVLPTVTLEGFGLVTVESLACGTPVIGTPIGATPEILEALEPRLLAQSAKPDALAKAILSFFGGEWGHALTPARLHRFVQERYSWDKHGQQTLALYQTLSKGSGPV